jgi:hypothetical protein
MDSGLRQNDVLRLAHACGYPAPPTVILDRAPREVIQNPFFGVLSAALKNRFWPPPE